MEPATQVNRDRDLDISIACAEPLERDVECKVIGGNSATPGSPNLFRVKCRIDFAAKNLSVAAIKEGGWVTPEIKFFETRRGPGVCIIDECRVDPVIVSGLPDFR